MTGKQEKRKGLGGHDHDHANDVTNLHVLYDYWAKNLKGNAVEDLDWFYALMNL